MEEKKKPGSLFFPLLLVALGVFIFLINIGTVSGSLWENLMQYWPVILIIAGLDGLYRRDGWVGPMVLLGLGTIMLLGNLHYLEFGGFALFLRLWPILLVAIGLDVIFGHRGSVWSNLFRVVIGLALVGGIVWLATISPFFSVGMKSVDFEQSLDKATSSDVRFAMAVGEMNLSGGADKDMLVSGNAGLPKEMTLDPYYSAPVNGKSSLLLEGNGLVIIPINTNISPWIFDLNSDIPMTLSTELGVGQMRIDLTGTNVNEINTEMGVGQTILTLPSGMDVDAVVSGAVGELIIRVPAGAEVVIKTDKAIVGSRIPDGYVRDGDTFRSPAAKTGADKITIQVDLAIGSISIEEID
ncbi:MAG: LiaF transmembrane domain-containing protein [Anaerolineaceae bacterium]